MNPIEIIITILLLMMVVPDLCARWRRPALASALYVIAGVLVSPFIGDGVERPLVLAGQVGFLLLLFEVGLEIDLPSWARFRRPVQQALMWMLLQFPVLLALARFGGFSWAEAALAATALTACSIGMAHGAWKSYPFRDVDEQLALLSAMVAIESIAIVLLSAGSSWLASGWTWRLPVQLAGVALVVWLISHAAPRLEWVFQRILETTTQWRVHLVALLVMVICAVGQRLGLSAPKTAFFLGLFLSRISHDGKSLEEYLAPISRRLLIPIFFFSLGLQVDVASLGAWGFVIAVAAAGGVLLFRSVVVSRVVRLTRDARASLLLGPNLPLAALAADQLLASHAQPEIPAALLVASVTMSTVALVWLPPASTPSSDAVPQGN